MNVIGFCQPLSFIHAALLRILLLSLDKNCSTYTPESIGVGFHNVYSTISTTRIKLKCMCVNPKQGIVQALENGIRQAAWERHTDTGSLLVSYRGGFFISVDNLGCSRPVARWLESIIVPQLDIGFLFSSAGRSSLGSRASHSKDNESTNDDHYSSTYYGQTDSTTLVTMLGNCSGIRLFVDIVRFEMAEL
ncbi:hypothetical protein BDQ17DRAFT_778913 [Cyathus striatus]|nr:hypothetical protein BDQ17DRAFT_778913 [Cyathus striatus]